MDFRVCVLRLQYSLLMMAISSHSFSTRSSMATPKSQPSVLPWVAPWPLELLTRRKIQLLFKDTPLATIQDGLDLESVPVRVRNTILWDKSKIVSGGWDWDDNHLSLGAPELTPRHPGGCVFCYPEEFLAFQLDFPEAKYEDYEQLTSSVQQHYKGKAKKLAKRYSKSRRQERDSTTWQVCHARVYDRQIQKLISSWKITKLPLNF